MKKKDQLNKMNNYVWVTEGQEIENYIPKQALEEKLGKENLPELGRYQYFYHEPTSKNPEKGYWQKHLSGTYNKVAFARSICKYLTKENLAGFDLSKQMDKVIDRIRKWNRR